MQNHLFPELSTGAEITCEMNFPVLLHLWPVIHCLQCPFRWHHGMNSEPWSLWTTQEEDAKMTSSSRANCWRLKKWFHKPLLSSTVWIKGLLHMLHLHLHPLQHFHFTKHLAFTASQHLRRRKSRHPWQTHSVGKTPLHLVTLFSSASVSSGT